MTDGTSQGLFIVVAIVIFGIFVVLAYILFEDTLSPALASMFTDATEQAKFRLDNDFILVGSWDDEINAENDVFTNTETHYEFMQYTDLSPIFNKYGEGEYMIEFEVKATSEGTILMYTQNSNTHRYTIGETQFHTTTEYTKHQYTVTANLRNASIEKSMLAFYGLSYESERFPTVKNVRIYKKNT